MPIIPVAFGSHNPPPDLAVIKVEGPQHAMFKGDEALVRAVVKADGMRDRDIEVQLLQVAGSAGGIQTAPSARQVPIQTRRIHINSNSERQQVEFTLKADKPEATSFEVRVRGVGSPTAVDPASGTFVDDAIAGNEASVFSVDMTDEPIKVLLVDGQPRWELQYLRNLLLRDKHVRVQHLLFEPAWIQPQTPIGAQPTDPQPAAATRLPAPRPIKHASVKDAMDEKNPIAEVTAWPKTVDDLFAFDVVILGDVSPKDLPVEQQRNLAQFVSERGGTLIAIAGKGHMPEEYAKPAEGSTPIAAMTSGSAGKPDAPDQSPLSQMLPVVLNPINAKTIEQSRLPYRLRLTDDGLRSDFMRLGSEKDSGGADTQRMWDRLPPYYWRCASVTAKPGAVVLATTQPAEPPSPGVAGQPSPRASLPASDSRTPTAEERAKRDLIDRQNPLIVAQNYGVGKVMFLGMEGTWLLRYKIGDKYHYKLWGQVMRWASGSRLSGKSRFFKLGAGRIAYGPGEAITIKADVFDKDYHRVKDADLFAIIKRGEEVVGQVNLLAEWMKPTTRPDDGRSNVDVTPSTSPDQADKDAAEGSAEGSPVGRFSGTSAPLPIGNYKIVLQANRVAGLTDEQRKEGAERGLVVEQDRGELRELAARSPTELSDLVLTPSTIGPLAGQLFGPPVVHERTSGDNTLWSSWELLAAFAVVASLEWILRKRAGLI